MEFVPVLDPVGLAVTVEFLPVPQQSRHQTEGSLYIHGRILISYDSTPGSTPAYLSPTGPQCTYKSNGHDSMLTTFYRRCFMGHGWSCCLTMVPE